MDSESQYLDQQPDLSFDIEEDYEFVSLKKKVASVEGAKKSKKLGSRDVKRELVFVSRNLKKVDEFKAIVGEDLLKKYNIQGRKIDLLEL